MYSFNFDVQQLPANIRLVDFIKDNNLSDEFILIGLDEFPSNHEVIINCSKIHSSYNVKSYFIDSILRTVTSIESKYNIHYYAKISKTPVHNPLYFKEKSSEDNKYDVFKRIFKFSCMH